MTLLLALLVVVLFLWSAQHASRLDALGRALEASQHMVAQLTQRIWLLEQGRAASHGAPRSPFRAPPERGERPAPGAFEPLPVPGSRSELAAASVALAHERGLEGTLSPAVAPPPADAPAAQPAQLPVDRPGIDWEKWLGVRGAAATGAAILLVALLYFLRYSIDAGILTPSLRVWLGAAGSAACVGVAHGWLRARHATLASWLTGAGLAGLYASLWASVHVVPLLGRGVAFTASIGVTALCIGLALRASALPIALLGLIGGFAAPLALRPEAAQPPALIAYLLLLGLSASALAIARRWWALSLCAMLASAAYQLAWSSAFAPPVAARLSLVLVFAALFGALPALAPSPPRASERVSPVAIATTYLAMLLAFCFALTLVVDPSCGAPAAVSLGLALASLCTFLAERTARAGLSAVALLGSLALALAWLGAHAPAAGPLAHVGLALAGFIPFAVAAWLRKDRAAALGLGASAASAALLVVIGASRIDAPAVWISALLLLASCVALAGWARGLPSLLAAAIVGSAIALGLVTLGALARGASLPVVVAASIAGTSALAAALGAARSLPAPHAAAVRAGVDLGALVSLAVVAACAPRLGLYGAALACAALAGLGWSARAEQAPSYPLSALLVAAALSASELAQVPASERSYLSLLALSGAALTVAPLVTGRQRVATPLSQGVVLLGFGLAALAPHATLARLALIAAVLSGASLLLLLACERTEARASSGYAFGVLGLSLGLLAAALGLDAGARVLAIAGLAALAVALDRRAPHATLAGGGVALLCVAAGLTLDPTLGWGRSRGEVPLLNALTLGYAAPVLASWLAHRTTRRERVRRVAAGLGLACGFLLVNVAVLDVFAVDGLVSLRGASQARDLAMSLGWALYAVLLLGLGLARDLAAVRWASLGLCVLTAGKVFLFDLNNLRDLHRVAALVGLAATLILISLSYQRFVLRRPTAAREA